MGWFFNAIPGKKKRKREREKKKSTVHERETRDVSLD